MKSKSFCLLVLLVLLGFNSRAQDTPSIDVSENVLVSVGQAQRRFVEPQVSANPRDPNHLIAVAITATDPPFASEQDCSAFVSFDGGRTWSHHDFGLKGCGDPWVALRSDSTAFFVALSGGMRFQQSTDGGRSWSPSTVNLGGGDHPTLIWDASGNLYLVASKMQRTTTRRNTAVVFTARSPDGGKSFPQRTSVVPSNLNNNTLTPAALSDGTLVVPFIDFQRNVDDFSAGGMLQTKRIWVLMSSDGGQTFSPPSFVSEACVSGFASLAADTSTSMFRDRLYLVCSGRDRDRIYVHYSSDRGERWSDPVRVDVPGENVVFRRTPAIAVNKDGVVGIAWYDRQKQNNKECQYIKFAASFDGGNTFLPEVRVSNAPSCPDTPQNGAAAKRWPGGGDYSGLTASSDGLFHVLWSDSRSGIYQLWTSRIRVNKTQ